MKRQNEVNAVEALLQILPFVVGTTYRHDRSPDDETSKRKEVDYILTCENPDQPSLAIEHTIVEAFKGQITYVNRSHEIVSEVDAKCKGSLPADRFYYLVVPHPLVGSLRRGAITRFVESVSAWVLEFAPKLSIDGHKSMEYLKSSVLLVCGGSQPEANGTVGTIPRRPSDQKNLALESLWFAIEHGLGKFSKYKESGHDTVLALQDISGEVHPSMLIEIETDNEKRALITGLVDYIFVFASVEDRMVVGNVWKERELRYDPSPFNRRFVNEKGKWSPME
jgi:hypothetical protein